MPDSAARGEHTTSLIIANVVGFAVGVIKSVEKSDAKVSGQSLDIVSDKLTVPG